MSELKDLSANARWTMEILGDYHESEDASEARVGRVDNSDHVLTPADLRKIAKGCTEIATWLEMRKAGSDE